jgi:peptidyl-prolyl cis-trans isomerase SurA
LVPHPEYRRSVVLLIALFTVSGLAACRSTPAPAAAPSAAAAPVSADTWAVVDGRPITRDAVEKAYRRISNPSEAASDEEALAAKLNVLGELIAQDILLAKARQLKVDVAESEVDAAYADAKKNVKDDAFQQELSRRQLTPADMRDALKRELLSEKVVRQEVGSKVTVSDQEVTDFFNANRAQFNVPEEGYHIAQIVVTPVRDQQLANRTGDDATTAEAAAAKAQMLMERLKSGAPFADVAMDYSEDPESAPRGGDLGLVPMSRLKQAPPPLRDAVLKGTPGSARLVSAGGAHTIVLVVSHEQAGQRDLSMPAVRQGVTETLRGRREQLLRAAYLTAVRSDAVVVNYLARRIVESQGKKP